MKVKFHDEHKKDLNLSNDNTVFKIIATNVIELSETKSEEKSKDEVFKKIFIKKHQNENSINDDENLTFSKKSKQFK
jgi:hypothetical protein